MTHIHLTLSLWIKVNNSQFQSQELIFESEVSHVWLKIYSREWTKKTRSTKSEKWRSSHTSVEIAWKNEQKADLKWLWRHMVVTKILTKEHSRTSPGVKNQRIFIDLTKNRQRTDYEWIGKAISKKIRQKEQKKQKINVTMPHVNTKTTSEKWKSDWNK